MRGGRGGSMPPDPLEIFSFLSISNSRLCSTSGTNVYALEDFGNYDWIVFIRCRKEGFACD